jgi:hypothetical protein
MGPNSRTYHSGLHDSRSPFALVMWYIRRAVEKLVNAVPGVCPYDTEPNIASCSSVCSFYSLLRFYVVLTAV